MNKKTTLAILCALAISNQMDACLKEDTYLQTTSTFFQENKSSILGAIAITAIAIPIYLYLTQPVKPLDNYKKLVNKTFQGDEDIINFIDHFSPPEDLLVDLIEEQNNFNDEQKKDFFHGGSFVSQNKALYPKNGNLLTRVVCAKRMQKIIEINNFTTIAVPKKYIFLSNDAQNIACFAETITASPNQKIEISLARMKELAKFIDITGFTDFGHGNTVIDSNNKLVFIDTEIRSFSLPRPEPNEKSKKLVLKGLKSYLEKTKIVTSEATDYLDALILKYNETGEKRNKVLPSMNEFDDKKLNLTKVYPALRKWNNLKRNHENLFWDKWEYDQHIQ